MTRKTLFFALMAVFLALLYAMIGYLALHPNVSESYRAYFIDHTREVMDDDGTRLRPVNPGQWIAHNSNDVGYIGFSSVEPEMRWSLGNKSAVLIDAACGPDWQDRVRIRLGSNGVQRAFFSLNSSAELALTVRPEAGEVELQFPPGTIKCGRNQLDIQLPDAHAPSATDARVLGLGFRAVAIE